MGLAHRLLTYAPWAPPMAHVWNKRLRVLPCLLSSACPTVHILLRQTFVPNVRHGVPARHDAYVLWMRPLDVSEGLRPSVTMQWDLSEVRLGAQVPSCAGAQESSCAGCSGVLTYRVRMLPPLLADAFNASLHLGCSGIL